MDYLDLSEEEYEREVRRRLWSRRWRTACEAVGVIAVCALGALVMLLGCFAFD